LIQPTLMKIAVIRPHAMNAPILGITMFDKKVPNRWTATLAEPVCAVTSVVM
jgi:hypothetical protein